MPDLAAFLLARITDDVIDARHAQARAASEGEDPGQPRSVELRLAARVIADCQAKRRMIAQLSEVDWASYPVRNTILGLLALPYVAHPEYRREWL